MKKLNFFLFITISLVLILAVTSVSFASDVNIDEKENNLNISNNYLNSPVELDEMNTLNSNPKKYYVSANGDDSNDGSEKHPFKTIKTGIKKSSNNSEIYIRQGTYSGDSNSGIVINKNLRIYSYKNEKVVINGNNNRIFQIKPNSEVYLNGLRFQNTKIENNGGAIYSEGILKINNCIFTNNSAKSGGAIYSTFKLTIFNSSFSENSANLKGGAVYHIGNNLNIDKSTYISNTAKSRFDQNEGGAVYNVGNNFKITNSMFYYNSALNTNREKNSEIRGGAVYNNGSNLYVKSNKFFSNYIEIRTDIANKEICLNRSYGGAIFSMGNNATFKDNEFSNDTAHCKYYNGRISIYGNTCYGGAIYTLSSEKINQKITLINNTFRNCSSATGAVWFKCDNGVVANNTFDNNKARYWSSSIMCYCTNMSFSNNTFINHNDTENMGESCIYMNGNQANVDGNYFHNNKANCIYFYNFGFSYETPTDFNITNNIFDSNEKGIYFYGSNGVRIENNTFTNNKRSISTYIGSKFNITGNYFGNNNGSYYGSGIDINSHDCIISNNIFYNNSAKMGGALVIMCRERINVTNNSFIGNNANNGGAIYAVYGSGNISSNIFINNTAENNTDSYLQYSSHLFEKNNTYNHDNSSILNKHINKLTRDYLSSKISYEKFVDEVNNAIARYFNGELEDFNESVNTTIDDSNQSTVINSTDNPNNNTNTSTTNITETNSSTENNNLRNSTQNSNGRKNIENNINNLISNNINNSTKTDSNSSDTSSDKYRPVGLGSTIAVNLGYASGIVSDNDNNQEEASSDDSGKSAYELNRNQNNNANRNNDYIVYSIILIIILICLFVYGYIRNKRNI